jgi:hypothetical protein
VRGQLAQEGVQRAELVVHLDAERLEHATDGEVQVVIRHPPRQRVADSVRERASGRECAMASLPGDEHRRDVPGLGLVRVVRERRGQRLHRRPLEPLRGGEPTLRVHPHVEGTIDREREAAGRIVDLHRRDAEVREEEVRPVRPPDVSDGGMRAGEVRAANRQDLLVEAEMAQARLRPGQLNRIRIEGEQPSAR